MNKNFTSLHKVIFSVFLAGIVNVNVNAQDTPAHVQLIHNAADPLAASVDIYIDDVLKFDNLSFRSATPFTDLPSNTPVKIGVAPATSTSSDDVIAEKTITFGPNTKNILVANGVITTSFYTPSPLGDDISIDVKVQPAAKDNSVDPGKVELSAYHGVTDAHVFDFLVDGGGSLVNNIGYGDFSSYTSVDPKKYKLYVTNYFNKDTLGAFDVDLDGLAGDGILLFTSGFLTPSANNNGPALALLAALPDGTVREFTPSSTTNIINKKEYAGMKAYPIPTHGQMTLEVNNDQASEAAIEVFNMYGLPVYHQEVQLLNGLNSLPIDLSYLTSGKYTVKISGENKVGIVNCTIVH